MSPIVPGSDATPLNVDEYEQYARAYLPKSTLDYYLSGADDMVTLKENRLAFQRLKLMPRVLRDVTHIDTSTTLLGHPVKTPVCIAPSAMQRMAHPDGELASSAAATAQGSCYILSTIGTTSIEDVAESSGSGLRWYQLYIFKDRELTRDLVVRAERAGYKALVLTVDTPVLGSREPDIRNNFALPRHLKMANFAHGKHAHRVNEVGLSQYTKELFDLNITWGDVAWLKSITSLPIVVKGVLTPEDAVIACDVGCKGILVSNHGARQLDGVPATIEALPGIVQAVQGRAEVYLDGGVRRGTDVFKALALGARAVFLGRPNLWGLAHNGQQGVEEVLKMLTSELAHAMMFSATTSLSEISPSYVRHEEYFLGSDATPLNLDEFEQYACAYLPKKTVDYYLSGADDMVTLKENRLAFQRLKLMPRILRDVTHIDTSTTLLGHPVKTPVCIAPSAMQKMAHPDGESAASAAATAQGSCYILSTMSTTSLEDVAVSSGDGLRWYQLYVFKDRDLTRELVVRAERAGYKALVLTVDTPILGSREPDFRNNFALPSHLTMANFTHGKHAHGVNQMGLSKYTKELFDLNITWNDVAWLKSITSLPIVVKGVLTPEDAVKACEVGCKGILVSNHGARQLDGVPATIEVLPAIVQAVQGRAEVYLDGGVRRGTDVFKALALGARAVFLGRPNLWGLAHSGQQGVEDVLKMLTSELAHAMMFSATTSLKDITPSYVRHEEYFRQPAKL
ncbi:peroxisomal (S)-2-hydroxy-acid oxidase [Thraustotheca clavata]|uniref:Peroxisomal (S)-2-hydroxy-acid oxidase n=1 Tax=Thraustotheca clavata TaxID=74557 RepID=A0A1W0A2X9_9STRA|nr:peroxisomal (S)-2-hydroxy-acid oxidase [Thraustotheca clavata]